MHTYVTLFPIKATAVWKDGGNNTGQTGSSFLWQMLLKLTCDLLHWWKQLRKQTNKLIFSWQQPAARCYIIYVSTDLEKKMICLIQKQPPSPTHSRRNTTVHHSAPFPSGEITFQTRSKEVKIYQNRLMLQIYTVSLPLLCHPTVSAY